jgi:hypothetical protein
MTIQYIAGTPVNLSPDSPPEDQGLKRAHPYKGGTFGQLATPVGYRGVFSRRHWDLPVEDQHDKAQDPDWTTKGVTYPVVGLVKRHHAQQMADKRQALYLASQGLGSNGAAIGGGVVVMLVALGLVALATK